MERFMDRKSKAARQVLLILVALAAGAFGYRLIGAKSPQPAGRKVLPPPPLVEVKKVKTSLTVLRISAQGTVEPLKVARLIPQVSGKVVFISGSMAEGGKFEKGDILVKIEPKDYELALDSATAALKNAESNFLQADESSRQARFEWELAHGKDGSKPPPLAVKLPQLEAARAARDAARAELEKAGLNLERTQIRAPFAGIVHEKNVDLGQYVTPGQSMATLYGTKEVEVKVPMELNKALELVIPGFNASQDAKGSKAVIKALEFDGQWTGYIVRSAGQVDRQTRMLDLFVRVKDPYLSKPPLAVGLFVDVEFQGPALPEGCFIPASALHGTFDDAMVWTVDSGNRLHIKRVEVADRGKEQILIRSGLKTGDLVIVSPVAEASDGMEVRIAQ